MEGEEARLAAREWIEDADPSQRRPLSPKGNMILVHLAFFFNFAVLAMPPVFGCRFGAEMHKSEKVFMRKVSSSATLERIILELSI